MASSFTQNLVPNDVNRSSKPKSCSCLNITKMILAALPTLVFGVFTTVFTLQQNLVARENRKQDQLQAEEKNIRSSFENFIDDISALLLDRKFNRSNPEHLLHIRIKTMTVLSYVDADRKVAIIWFLYESRLLRADRPENERLHLNGSDLSNLQFIGRPASLLSLSFLYLPGVYASNIAFQWCNLVGAVFNDAVMPNAKIIHSLILNSSFRQVYAPGLILGDLVLYGNDFQGAILHRAEFASGIDIFGEIDLTNSDLLHSFRAQQLVSDANIFAYPTINYRNARFSNGSFGPIDESNLVINGGAEDTCQSKENGTFWDSIASWPLMTIGPVHNDNDSYILDSSVLGNCSFFARSSGEQYLTQYTLLILFSVLIDSGQGAYNISAYAGCFGQGSNQITIIINFFKDNMLTLRKQQVLKIESEPQQWTNVTGNIPVDARIMQIEIHSLIVNSTGWCLVDNVKLNIFYNKTGQLIFIRLCFQYES
ncbi:unnamed protein product [Rotaria socialis]|uniref:Uncharacterized protein n=1 Tax=Rotaria socialis TaxID=392032 RepID=A0A817U0N0_9BILA|nr:unnamed protein product [Rotaria socialis]CAF3326956.1 unnamed protein product [Rotaria socialis]CAF3661438.1 unnamed protein product [Rotaria socialis]CAF4272121.1 unnamed protein product [Rotaria socialis]CAF4487942.1 unnamed protein product [Rotaria socialis]